MNAGTVILAAMFVIAVIGLAYDEYRRRNNVRELWKRRTRRRWWNEES